MISKYNAYLTQMYQSILDIKKKPAVVNGNFQLRCFGSAIFLLGFLTENISIKPGPNVT